LLFVIFAFAQAEVTIPARTPVQTQMTQDIPKKWLSLKDKELSAEVLGASISFTIVEDVKLKNGTVVIAKNSAVKASITQIMNKRDLKLEVQSVTAVDGTEIALGDCWILITKAQDKNSRANVAGLRKNCETKADVKIKTK
jgi:hypothetical protein